MTLGEQITFGYGILSVLATVFSLLMLYWQYKKPEKPVKIPKDAPIFTRMVAPDTYRAFIQLPDGSAFGPFLNFKEAEEHRYLNS